MKPPPVPGYKTGTQVGDYIEACHMRLWALLDIADPGPNQHTGDCLVEADKVIEKRGKKRD